MTDGIFRLRLHSWLNLRKNFNPLGEHARERADSKYPYECEADLTEFAGKSILVVDDDNEIRQSIEAALQPLGPDLLTADNGNDAVELALEKSPDLVILDMMLPKRSGFLVLEKIKRGKGKGQKPLVVMITANTGHRHKAYAQTLGVDGYLLKPFHIDRLIETVRQLFVAEDET